MPTPLHSKAKGLPFAEWPSDEQDQYMADACAAKPDLRPTRHLNIADNIQEVQFTLGGQVQYRYFGLVDGEITDLAPFGNRLPVAAQ